MESKHFIASPALILTLLIFISLSGNAQTREDSLMFQAVNQFRARHNLPRLTWDSAIYNEAKITYQFQLNDTDAAGGDKLLTPVIAGEHAEYFWEIVDLDGELDTSTIAFLTLNFIAAIDSIPGERWIFDNPGAHSAGCFLGKRSIFIQNPAKNSRIKQFPEWVITLIIGISF